MSLTEWIQQFFKDHFSASAEKASTPAKLPDTWPHGHSWDPLGLYTYEEKEQMMQDRLAKVALDTDQNPPPHELLPITWPDGTAWDTAQPFWVKETGKTYETLEDAVEDMGKTPRQNHFGALKFG